MTTRKTSKRYSPEVKERAVRLVWQGGDVRTADYAFEERVAGAAGALIQLCMTGFKFVASSVDGAVRAGRSIFGVGSELGVALLAVGYIVGLNIATLVFVGGLISWLFGIPIYTALADPAGVAALTAGSESLYEAAERWDDLHALLEQRLERSDDPEERIGARVRLARNLSRFPFPGWARKSQRKEVLSACKRISSTSCMFIVLKV